MIQIEVDDDTLFSVRIATSPLWETLSSLALLARNRGEVPFPYGGWARSTRRALSPLLRDELIGWMRRLHPLWLPSVLTPIPTSSAPDLHDELIAVKSRLAEAGSNDIPDDFVEMIEDYWQVGIAPYWSSMKAALEEEILFRGRTLATEGADVLLSSLGGRVEWDRPRLAAPCQIDGTWQLTGTTLLIVPLVFARGMRIFSVDRRYAALSYQARGAVVLDENEPTGERPVAPDDDRLAVLLGRGRAAVMRALVVPTTTKAVADFVGLAPSTVSQHLTALSTAGVVRRRRVGSRVLYELDRGGFALLSHLENGTT